jgi:hypothetical protein
METKLEEIRNRFNGVIFSYELADLILSRQLHKKNETLHLILGLSLRNIIITVHSLLEARNQRTNRKDHLSLDQLIYELPDAHSNTKERFSRLFKAPDSKLKELRSKIIEARKAIAHSLEPTIKDVNLEFLRDAVIYVEVILTDLYNRCLPPLPAGQEYNFAISHQYFREKIERDLAPILLEKLQG